MLCFTKSRYLLFLKFLNNRLYRLKINIEFENFPMLIKWRKNKFQKFLPGTIFKIKKRDQWRWRVPVLYYMQPTFRINRITDMEIVRGDQNCTQTHTQPHTHTHTHTHKTHTHTGCPFYNFFFQKRKKTKKGIQSEGCARVSNNSATKQNGSRLDRVVRTTRTFINGFPT